MQNEQFNPQQMHPQQVQPQQMHPQNFAPHGHQPGQLTKGKIFLITFFTSLFVSIAVFIIMYIYFVPLIVAQKRFSLPDIRGAKLEYSKSILEGRGLLFTLNGEENDSLVPVGCVIKQEPAPGTMVKKGDIVQIIVSKGKRMAAVPNVLNMTVEQAAIEITKVGLIPDKMEKIQSASVPKGCVISVEPQQGTSLELGSRINLVVSEGPPRIVKSVVIPKVSVPDVVGKYLDEAQKIFESKGLKLGKINKSYSDDQDFDVVLIQYPKAGMNVNKGSEVSVTINAEVQQPQSGGTEPAPITIETPAQ